MKLSIIMPNYNNGKYIKKCIDSILKQSYKDFELIIVDDGSTDNSVEIIDQYTDSRIKKIVQYNQNAAIARNRALHICKGDYVYFIDSDDELYDENVLMNMLNDIKNNDLLLSNYIVVDKNSKIIKRYNIDDDYLINTDSVYKYSLISPVPSNKLYKNELIKKYKLYFDNVRIGQDLNFYLKYLCICKNIIQVNYYSYKYRVLENSISRIKNLNFLDILNSFKFTKKFYNLQNLDEDYDKYISICEMLHYNAQFNKIKNARTKKEKKAIYYYILYCLSTINTKKCNKDDNYKIFKNKIILKKILYRF